LHEQRVAPAIELEADILQNADMTEADGLV
jgi:hypothetical protein